MEIVAQEDTPRSWVKLSDARRPGQRRFPVAGQADHTLHCGYHRRDAVELLARNEDGRSGEQMRPRSRNVLAQTGEGGFRVQFSAQAVGVKGTTDTAAIQALRGTRIKSDRHVRYRFHSSGERNHDDLHFQPNQLCDLFAARDASAWTTWPSITTPGVAMMP